MPDKITLVLDSSQISKFSECPMLWNLSYNRSLGLRAIEGEAAPREDMMMGSYGHAMLEMYYKTKALGGITQDCIDAGREVPVDEFPLTDENREKVKSAFEMYWKVYTGERMSILMGPPAKKITFDPSGMIPKEEWELNPLVEKGFSYKLHETNDYLFVLEGRIDLMVSLDGIPVFIDHKFQSREKSLYGKRIQLRNYSLVTGFDLGGYNYIRYHKTVTNKTFERKFTSFSSFERQWWKNELIKIYTRIAHSVYGKEFEQRWESCEGKYWPCVFNKVCNERNLDVRENIIQLNFEEKPRWSPW